MTPVSIITLLLAVLAVVAIVSAFFIYKGSEQKVAALRDQLESKELELRNQLTSKELELREATAREAAAREKIALLNTRIEADNLNHKDVQDAFRAEFRVLANNIFEEKSTQFKQVNQESLELLLKPFRDNISDFKKRIEEIHTAGSSHHGELKTEIKNLIDQTSRISSEANRLTAALRGNSKTQGDWGEMILEKILEDSGLEKDVHFTTQQTRRDEEGKMLRPDVVLNLPEKKHIVIDSKVSLTAFVNYVENQDDPVLSKKYMTEHILSVRNHIRELSAKGYHNLLTSPDFVIMFMPNEPAFLAALHADSSLWSEAYCNKVIISGPTNLFAVLKIVRDLWRNEELNRNVREIAKAGSGLYDKLVGFAKTFAEIGSRLDSTRDSYDKAMGQLKTGKGNLLSRSEKLRELEGKLQKELPAALADYEPHEEE